MSAVSIPLTHWGSGGERLSLSPPPPTGEGVGKTMFQNNELLRPGQENITVTLKFYTVKKIYQDLYHIKYSP